jgi:hypothetical protein
VTYNLKNNVFFSQIELWRPFVIQVASSVAKTCTDVDNYETVQRMEIESNAENFIKDIEKSYSVCHSTFLS